MTRLGLLMRNLWFFRRSNLAILAGLAVATAVLTGALMVGDSVRASLAELARQRLGQVDYALVSSRFFPEDLGARLAEDGQLSRSIEEIATGISLRGGVTSEDESVRAAGVQVFALDRWIAPKMGDAVINAPVAESLLLKEPGATVLLKLPKASDTPLESTLANRGADEVASGLRAAVSGIERGRGFASMFSLAGTQRTPANLWLNLRDLQSAVDQPRKANLLLASVRGHDEEGKNAAALNEALRRVATLADYGLRLGKSPGGDEVILNSTTTFISPEVQRAAGAAAKKLGIEPRRVSVYLINNVTKVGSTSKTHYAIAAAVDPPPGGPIERGQAVVNAWMADQLELKVGDKLRLDFYKRKPDGELTEVSGPAPGQVSEFTVARIIPMTGLGADRTLTPEYKGLTDADRFRDWDPPVGLDIEKDKADEPYWEKYKAAPKLFLRLEEGEQLWGSPQGDLTSLRIPAARAEEFAAELLRQIDPGAMGMTFVPIRAQQLAAADGSTDFAGLFIGFSFFIIAAAALLVAMLFRLGIEQRARQFGLLSALGFTPRSMRRLALLEGLILALVGAAVGTALAIGYTWLMVAGLRSWWVGAVGTTALELEVAPVTLAIGFAASVLLALAVIAWSVWRLGRAQAAALLAGSWGQSEAYHGGRAWGLYVGNALLSVGLLMVVLGAAGMIAAQAAFMSGGALLLMGSLVLAAAVLKRIRRRGQITHWSIAGLGWRNAGRHRARSVTTIALIAFATFILVTVAAMRQGEPADTHDIHSGTGGYQLIVRSDVPLLGDPATERGRETLGVQLDDAEKAAWARATFLPLRRWEGQDISCLNLTRPTTPTILGVPESLEKDGRFAPAGKNPWPLLRQREGDAIPVIADSEAAAYILKLGVGDTLSINDQLGRPRTLKLVATLPHSIFQGELLMSEAHFRELFPAQAGFGTVLVSAPDADLPEIRRLLSLNLADFSIEIERTADRLMRYQEVANTYLSTFQALGSLGLLLGTIGLGVVLLRNLIERRGELALLAAIGFGRPSRLWLVLAENAGLLIVGLLAGAICALVGVLPAVVESRQINWLQLALTLAAVLFTGLLVLVAAVWMGSRHITPADLRPE